MRSAALRPASAGSRTGRCAFRPAGKRGAAVDARVIVAVIGISLAETGQGDFRCAGEDMDRVGAIQTFRIKAGSTATQYRGKTVRNTAMPQCRRYPPPITALAALGT